MLKLIDFGLLHFRRLGRLIAKLEIVGMLMVETFLRGDRHGDIREVLLVLEHIRLISKLDWPILSHHVLLLYLSERIELLQRLPSLELVDLCLELLVSLLLLVSVDLLRSDLGILAPQLPSLVPQHLLVQSLIDDDGKVDCHVGAHHANTNEA
jgi:hypothetical protein